MNSIKGIIFDLGNTLMYMGHEWGTVLAQGGSDLAEFLVGKGIDVEPRQFADDFISLRRSLRAKAIEQQVEYTADYALMTLLARHGHENLGQGLIAKSSTTEERAKDTRQPNHQRLLQPPSDQRSHQWVRLDAQLYVVHVSATNAAFLVDGISDLSTLV